MVKLMYGRNTGAEVGIPVRERLVFGTWFRTACLILIFLGLILVFVLVLLPGSGEAKNITVDDSGGADFLRLQDALDSAEEGDTIRVYEGRYTGPFTVKTTVTLLGNGSKETILEAPNSRKAALVMDAKGTLAQGFCFLNCSTGVYIGSDNLILSDNIFGGQGRAAIQIGSSRNATLSNNTMGEQGILFDSRDRNFWDSHSIDSSNTVDGKPVRYFVNKEGVDLGPGPGQIILVNCKDFLIRGHLLGNVSPFIQMAYSSGNIIQDLVCSGDPGMDGSYDHIYLFESQDNILENLVLDRGHGFTLKECSNNLIRDSVLGEFDLDGSENDITRCRFVNSSWEGLVIYGDRNQITACSFLNNSRGGMSINGRENLIFRCDFSSNSGDGVTLAGKWNTVSDCQFLKNLGRGMYLGGDGNNVSDCQFLGNFGDGLEIYEYAEKNNILRCTFIDNGEYGIRITYPYGGENTNKLTDNYYQGNQMGDKRIKMGEEGYSPFPSISDSEIFLCFGIFGFCCILPVVLVLFGARYGHKRKERRWMRIPMGSQSSFRGYQAPQNARYPSYPPPQPPLQPPPQEPPSYGPPPKQEPQYPGRNQRR